MLSLAWWWLAVELLGLVALPISFITFRRLPDRGYAWSKALGILLVSYLLWLGGETRLLPNSRTSIIIVLLLLAAGSFWLSLRHRQQLRQYLAQNLRLVLTVEALFIALFLLWAWLRAYNSEIRFTEKPMELAFLNAVVRSSYFPPQDPWLAGQPLNYYYFGYVMIGMLVKLTGVAPGVGFNLAIALLFALTALGAFGLVYNLVAITGKQSTNRKGIYFGLVAIFLLLFLANWEGVLEFAYARGWGSADFWSWIGIKGLTPSPGGGLAASDYWWWRATRVIDTLSNGVSLDYTITEFPFFSFLLGDLHAHVMSLPFVLLFLGMCLNYLCSRDRGGLGWLRQNPLAFVLLALSLGSLGFVHTWDLPTYSAVFIIIVFMKAYLAPGNVRRYLHPALFVVALLATTYLFYLPFSLQYRSPVSLILPWDGPGTRPVHYLLLWIPFLFIGISFLVSHVPKPLTPSHWGRDAWRACPVVLLPFVVWVVAGWIASALTAGTMGAVSIWGKLWQLLPLLLILVFILLILAQIMRKAREAEGARSTLFVLTLILVAFSLIYGSELFYLLDIHGARINTVFRLYYQAWLMLSVASAFAIYHFSQSNLRRHFWKTAWWAGCLVLLAGAFSYVPAAAWSKTNAFAGPPTLDGLAFEARSQPSEWRAIEYLNSIKGTPVIVEAAGPDYTAYGRVSAYTGLPTILGWLEHEWQWRGNPGYLKGRQQDIDLIYLSQDQEQVKTLLRKYDVTYVYAGRLEQQKYGEQNLQKFAIFMEAVFLDDGVAIYKVKS